MRRATPQISHFFFRFDPLHSVEASARKETIAQLRLREKGLAEIIWRIAKERKNRRAREFALRALKLQRAGLQKEKLEADKRAAEERRQVALAAERRAREELVAAALLSEDKWRAEDQVAQRKRLDRRLNYSEVQIHMGFGQSRPAPKTRQHSLTWRLNLFDEDGLAISEEGANMVRRSAGSMR